TITFLRDAGFLGSGCTHEIRVDDKAAFAIRAGEYQTLHLSPGQHEFGLLVYGAGCPQHTTSHVAFLRENADATYRITIPSLAAVPSFVDAGGGRLPDSVSGLTFFQPTPGVSLTLRETERRPSTSGTYVQYELRASGFAVDARSVLWWNRGRSYTSL